MALDSRFRLLGFAICWLSLLCLPPGLYAWQLDDGAGKIPVSKIGQEEHPGGTLFTEVAEDARGHIYIGNEAGGMHFDGKSWSLLPPTGHSPLTTTIHIDQRDRIWVGGTDHLGYYEADARGQLRFHDFSEDLFRVLEGEEHGMTWNIYSDKNQHYFVTSFHVLIWDGAAWHRHNFKADRRILSTWLEGQLYIHARGDGLYRFRGNKPKKILSAHEAISSGIMKVLSTDGESLRLATLTNGIWTAREGSLRKERDNPSPDHFAMSHIVLDEDRLLIGQANGLFMIEGNGDAIQINPNEIAAAPRLFKSTNGTIWITSNRSSYRLLPSKRSIYGKSAEHLLRHRGEIYRESNSTLRPLKEANQDPIASGWLSNPISRGQYLICAEGKTLHAYQDEAHHLSIPLERPCHWLHKCAWDEQVFYSMDEPEVTRWQVTQDGIAKLSRTKESNQIFTTLADTDADTSLYTTNDFEVGLIHWPPREEQSLTPSIEVLSLDPGNSQKFQYLRLLQFGKKALMATDRGLFAYNSEQRNFTPLNLFEGKLGRTWNDFVYCPNPDGKGVVIYAREPGRVSGYRFGLLRYTDQNGYIWKPLQLKGLDEAGTVRALLHEIREETEYLWVGGSKNLLRYEINDLAPPPPLEVNLSLIEETAEGATHYGGFGPLPKTARFAYPQKSLRIDYTVPPATLAAKGYQTRLIGFSENWSKPTELTSHKFNNLYEGDYSFEVRAIDELGRAGPSTSFAFTILPPWYRSPYAYLGYVALVFGLILLIARFWTQHLYRRNLELEAIVTQRTEELVLSNQQLREANSIKQNFLASMSHEIRNPLNGILGIAQLLGQEQATDRTRVNHLNACATHLHQLLGQVLDFSSIESGKLETRPVPFDPNQLIGEVFDMHQVLAEKKGLSLKLSHRKTNRFWIGDPVLLRQSLINLVSNAIKYTPSGVVHLRVVYENRNGSLHAQFIVEDTGPGIPEGKQDYIFQEFTRLSRAGESEIAGTGLGLAIAKEMAERMQGTLQLDSHYRDGARFVLALPFDTGGPIPKKTSPDRPDEGQPLLGKQVLVADDMDFNRYICRELLEKLGARVSEVEDGQDALKALQKDHFDLAILDINMPKLDGHQVVRQFSEQRMGNPPLFIALTAHVTGKMEQEALGAGFQHFIEKPLDPDQIMQIALAQPLRDRKAAAPDLLSYLAGDDRGSKSRLRKRYLKSMTEQIELLHAHIEQKNYRDAEEALHKLRGLANMQRREDVVHRMDQLSLALASHCETEPALEQVRQLATLIVQH